MTDEAHGPDIEHELANQLGLISGYCNLLLEDMSGDDPHRADLLEIHKAVTAALDLLGRLRRRAS